MVRVISMWENWEYEDRYRVDRVVPVCVKGGSMNKDWKQRRASAEEIRRRNLGEEKRVDPKALEKFHQRPYQLIYMEKMRQIREEDTSNRSIKGKNGML